MARKGFEMVRYADDFVVLCANQQEAQKALESLGAVPNGGAATLSALLLNWQNDPGEKKIADALDDLEKQLAPFIKLAAKRPA